MEINTTKSVLVAQDLSGVENIILTHLTDRNSNEARFVDEIKATTGKQMFSVRSGLKVRLTKKSI